jgi:hypothetical protein
MHDTTAVITIVAGGSDGSPPVAYPSVVLQDPLRQLASRFRESMLAQVVAMRVKEAQADHTRNLILDLPKCDGRLFYEVLKFVEDPEGYVLPEKDADAIRQQLAYLGLTDLHTEARVKTRRQIEAECARRVSTREALARVVLIALLAMDTDTDAHLRQTYACLASDRAFTAYLSTLVKEVNKKDGMDIETVLMDPQLVAECRAAVATRL